MDRYWPKPWIRHPWPGQRFDVKFPRWEPDGLTTTSGSVRGAPGNRRPYSDPWTCRNDNWLNNDGKFESLRGQKIKKNMYRLFFPTSRKWRDNPLRKGALLIDETVKCLATA